MTLQGFRRCLMVFALIRQGAAKDVCNNQEGAICNSPSLMQKLSMHDVASAVTKEEDVSVVASTKSSKPHISVVQYPSPVKPTEASEKDKVEDEADTDSDGNKQDKFDGNDPEEEEEESAVEKAEHEAGHGDYHDDDAGEKISDASENNAAENNGAAENDAAENSGGTEMSASNDQTADYSDVEDATADNLDYEGNSGYNSFTQVSRKAPCDKSEEHPFDNENEEEGEVGGDDDEEVYQNEEGEVYDNAKEINNGAEHENEEANEESEEEDEEGNDAAENEDEEEEEEEEEKDGMFTQVSPSGHAAHKPKKHNKKKKKKASLAQEAPSKKATAGVKKAKVDGVESPVKKSQGKQKEQATEAFDVDNHQAEDEDETEIDEEDAQAEENAHKEKSKEELANENEETQKPIKFRMTKKGKADLKLVKKGKPEHGQHHMKSAPCQNKNGCPDDDDEDADN